jgi:hypothetical protein
MRVQLRDEDAAMIAAALRRCDESDRLVALADAFDPPERLTAVIVDDVPTCPRCGNATISYVEGCEQYWPHGLSADGAVWLDTIGWDGIGESGDSDPGLFCDNYDGGGCGAPIDLPDGWEVDWR